MFRDMRRNRQMLSREESIGILNQGTSGVLAVSGDEGYPYAVPLSYVYRDGRMYFHCARAGHKLDALKNTDKASFCVIAQDDVIPEKYTTCFRSVIVFGRLRILEEDREKRAAAVLLADKYAPEADQAGRDREIEEQFDRLCILELSIEHMTGKEAIELTRARSSFS